MSLTIQLPLTIEQHLRETAIKQGISLENYVMQILTVNSRKETKKKKALTESDLLVRIQLNVLPTDLEEFYHLTSLFKSGTISETEHEKLTQLNELIEIAHADRMKYLLALAQLRHVSLETAMCDLGIKQHLA